MKSRLVLLVTAVLLLGTLIGGGTFAFFAASTPTQSNTFTAGTLTIALTDTNGDPLDGPFMTYTEMAPGDTGGPYHAYVQNTGSLPLVYNFNLIQMAPDLPSIEAAAANDDTLADNLIIRVERETDLETFTVLGEMTVTEWLDAGISDWQPALDAGERAHFRFTAILPLGTGNEAQAGSVTLALLISATQTSVVEGGGETEEWSGSFVGLSINENRETGRWHFTASVTWDGDSFTGTMWETDDPSVGPTTIRGTRDGNLITGVREDYPFFFGPIDIPFNGTIQDDGTLVVGDWADPFDETLHGWSATQD